MKYTKQQLLGAKFKWTYEYIVVEDGEDVQLKAVSDGQLYSYNLARLNTELKYLVSLAPSLTYEIY